MAGLEFDRWPESLTERIRLLPSPRRSSDSAGKSENLKSPLKLLETGQVEVGGSKPILYWTHHALRTDENPALEVAKRFAIELDRPLLVYQGLSATYRYASDRHHRSEEHTV